MSDKKSETPSVSTYQVEGSHSSYHGIRLVLIVVGLLLIAGLLLLVYKNKDTTLTPTQSAHLLYSDPVKNVLTLTDSATRVTSKTPYPPNAYVNYEAASPDGGTLLSLSITTSNSGFIFIKNGKAQTLSEEAVKVLRSAIVLDTSHRLFFSDNNTVVFVVCGSSCKLISLNLQTGKVADIIDSGVSPSNILAPVYPLGLSSDGKSVYLHVTGANKLSKDSNGGIYQVELASHKVLHATALTQEVGYTLKLSPDKKKFIYKSGGNGSPTVLHIIDSSSGKESTTKWDKGDIANQTSAFHWSPDSTKVLFQTVSLNLPVGSSRSSAKPIVTAYLNVPKMTVTTLQTIDDPAHNRLSYQAWLNSSQVAYEIDTSSQLFDFTNPNMKAYAQDIASKKITNLPSLGRLVQVVYW